MAFEIKIKGKNGFFRKTAKLDINKIIKKLGFGIGYYNDAYVLQVGQVKNNTCIVYNPRCIGRGIFLDVSKLAEDNEIKLSYHIPTTETEIGDFFSLAKEIIDCYGKVKLYNADETFTVDNFFAQKDSMIAFSLEELKKKASFDYNRDSWIITMAMFPYTFSDAERNAFSKAATLDEFEKKLHEVQLQDVYYAKPNLYHERNKGINMAVYTLTEDCRSAFPLDGSNSLITIHLDANIDEACVRFYILSEDKMIDGHFNYAKFIELAKDKSQEYLDKEHIIIPPLSKEELTEMADYLKENGYLTA